MSKSRTRKFADIFSSSLSRALEGSEILKQDVEGMVEVETKVNGIEAAADVTDTANVGSAITGFATGTDATSTDLIPVYDVSSGTWEKQTIANAALQGPQGIQGPAGADGSIGVDGADGPQGPQGNTGSQGPQGNTGSQGSAGADGSQGPAGADGSQGPQGNTGPQGPQGNTGSQGPQGNTGPQGATGTVSYNLGQNDLTNGDSIYMDNWYRSTGATGWYNQTYGGGIHMSDTTWVRTYGGKALYVANQIAASGNVSAYYSDMRLKTKEGNLENALDKVCSLEGFYYHENEVAKSFGYNTEGKQVALSAQAVQAVMPEVVSRAPFDIGVDESGASCSKSGEDYLTVDYAKLVPLLVEAIKELKQEIVELKER